MGENNMRDYLIYCFISTLIFIRPSARLIFAMRTILNILKNNISHKMMKWMSLRWKFDIFTNCKNQINWLSLFSILLINDVIIFRVFIISYHFPYEFYSAIRIVIQLRCIWAFDEYNILRDVWTWQLLTIWEPIKI